MIKLVIFDFGNVIARDTENDFEIDYGINRIPKYKRDKYEIAKHWTEKGKKPTSELMKAMKWAFDLPISVQEVEKLMLDTKLNKEVWNLVQEIKNSGQYQVAILSNNQRTWPDKAAKKMKISYKGIKFYNSAFIGKRKPGPGIYKYVLQKEKVKAQEAVFIDDKQSNVAGAKKIGVHAIQFSGNVSKLKHALKKLGIEVKIKRK